MGLVAAVALPLALYLATAARDIMVGDNPEFVGVAATLGVGHPPGYPLVAMLGHLLSLIPVGPLAFRINALSAICGAGASGLVFLTAFRLTQRPAPSLVAAYVLAFNPLFWSWSLEAEAFALSNLLSAALMWLLVMWHEQPERQRWLLAAAVVAGLGLANHQTIVLLAPAAFLVLWQRRRAVLARPGVVLRCALLLAAGLTTYLYLPWASSRHPYFDWGDLSSTGDLLGMVLRRDYGTLSLAADAPSSTIGAMSDRLLALTTSFTAVELVLVIPGVVSAYRHRRWYFAMGMLAFLVSGPLFIAYANLAIEKFGLILLEALRRGDPDIIRALPYLFVMERFFLLGHVVLAPFAALGVVSIGEWIAGRVRPGLQRFATLAVAVVAIAALGAGVAVNYRDLDRSTNHVARQYGEDLLASLPPHAILLASGDEKLMPVAYLQAVEHARPDVTVVYFGVLNGTVWYANQLQRRDPDLVMPAEFTRAQRRNWKTFIQANQKRPTFAMVGAELDLGGDFWFYPVGLVEQVLPLSADRHPDQLEADNLKAFAQYHPPAKVRAGTFEDAIWLAYPRAAWKVGQAYEDSGLKADAKRWYEKALAIAPGYEPARTALNRLG